MKLKDKTYITDEKGKQVGVIIDMADYNKILNDLEELESIRAYDKAKASGDDSIPFDTAIKEIEKS